MPEKVKTLLVIGNGFDLTHGLKTKYTDFLKFFNEEIGTVPLSEQLSDIDIAGMKKFLGYINCRSRRRMTMPYITICDII